jgi:hypothetical protein
MGKLMLQAEEYPEFERWWKNWISNAGNVVVESAASGRKPGADAQSTANAWSGNLAHGPDAALGITQ